MSDISSACMKTNMDLERTINTVRSRKMKILHVIALICAALLIQPCVGHGHVTNSAELLKHAEAAGNRNLEITLAQMHAKALHPASIIGKNTTSFYHSFSPMPPSSNPLHERQYGFRLAMLGISYVGSGVMGGVCYMISTNKNWLWTLCTVVAALMGAASIFGTGGLAYAISKGSGQVAAEISMGAMSVVQTISRRSGGGYQPLVEHLSSLPNEWHRRGEFNNITGVHDPSIFDHVRSYVVPIKWHDAFNNTHMIWADSHAGTTRHHYYQTWPKITPLGRRELCEGSNNMAGSQSEYCAVGGKPSNFPDGMYMGWQYRDGDAGTPYEYMRAFGASDSLRNTADEIGNFMSDQNAWDACMQACPNQGYTGPLALTVQYEWNNGPFNGDGQCTAELYRC